VRQDDPMRGPYDTGRFADVGDMDNVTTIKHAADVVRRMRIDLLEHPNEWENSELERFLEALAASLEDIPKAYANRDEQFPKEPTWRILTEVLVMATGYE
jgi:hypothetical protein